jgi:hypothetical protein
MNLPPWLAAELDKAGQQNASRAITRQEAVTAVRDAIMTQADRAFILSVTADYAARLLDTWHRGRRGDGKGSGQLAGDAQSELFPGLPVRLYIRPGVAKAVILLTAHDWDTAKAMIENRTSGAITAAETDQAAFDAAYALVRPLLAGDLTTADVAGSLDGPAAAASP